MAQMRLMRGLAVVSLALAVACGGDGGGGAGSGVDRQKKASELTMSEAEDVCHATTDDYPGDESVCTLIAVSQHEDKASCEAGIKSCRDSFASAGDLCDDAAAALESCDATVGDFEDCFEENNDRLNSLVAKVSCDDISGGRVELGKVQEQALPAACERAMKVCSDFF